MVDESRALEAESVYDFEVLSPSHNSRMRCAIQVSVMLKLHKYALQWCS